MAQSFGKRSSSDGFSGFFGILVATAGSAVGMGNLYRFPYQVGTNGGSAYIIIYLVFVLLIGLPVMLTEFILGRQAKSNLVDVFGQLGPRKSWKGLAYLAMAATLLILGFYSVVGGWTLDYVYHSIKDVNLGAETNMDAANFSHLVTSPLRPLQATIFFVIASAWVVSGGIKKGIERASKYMMPFLFLAIILLAVRSLTLPGAQEGVKFLFKPDFSTITGKTVLAAMGQAFFSLSLGMGCIVTYGSYISKKEPLPKLAVTTVAADTLFALLASVAIMPAVFAFGISPSEGPGLVFVTLPGIFVQMPMGKLIAIFFFLVMFVAAFTSVISMLEIFVSVIVERWRFSRRGATLLISGVVMVLAVLCSLSQGVLGHIKLFGRTIFDFFDYLSANILIPIGALLTVLFVGWRMGKSVVYNQYTNEKSLKGRTFKAFYFLIRYVVPVAIVMIFINGLS